MRERSQSQQRPDGEMEADREQAEEEAQAEAAEMQVPSETLARAKSDRVAPGPISDPLLRGPSPAPPIQPARTLH
jgi:hypothetical protein